MVGAGSVWSLVAMQEHPALKACLDAAAATEASHNTATRPHQCAVAIRPQRLQLRPSQRAWLAARRPGQWHGAQRAQQGRLAQNGLPRRLQPPEQPPDLVACGRREALVVWS